MDCQKDIARKIKEKEAEFILAVKENQKHLHDDIQEAFKHGKIEQTHIQTHLDHGRIEKRTSLIITKMDWVSNN